MSLKGQNHISVFPPLFLDSPLPHPNQSVIKNSLGLVDETVTLGLRFTLLQLICPCFLALIRRYKYNQILGWERGKDNGTQV